MRIDYVVLALRFPDRDPTLAGNSKHVWPEAADVCRTTELVPDAPLGGWAIVRVDAIAVASHCSGSPEHEPLVFTRGHWTSSSPSPPFESGRARSTTR